VKVYRVERKHVVLEWVNVPAENAQEAKRIAEDILESGSMPGVSAKVVSYGAFKARETDDKVSADVQSYLEDR